MVVSSRTALQPHSICDFQAVKIVESYSHSSIYPQDLHLVACHVRISYNQELLSPTAGKQSLYDLVTFTPYGNEKVRRNSEFLAEYINHVTDLYFTLILASFT